MLDLKKGAQIRGERKRILDSGLEKRIATYAAAGAAGVGMLALAAPAQAEIVYTPADLRVSQAPCCDSPGIKIDLNNDGVKDFSVWIWSYADFGPTYVDLFLYAKNRANGVRGADRGFAARLNSGAIIGSSQKFAQARTFRGIPLVDMDVQYTGIGREKTSFCYGPWSQPAKNGYLGVRFDISGQTHYGWIRLTTGACIGGGRLDAIITGYAYNTEPGQPIFAGEGAPGAEASTVRPESGTLGQLALGSLGLALGRRREHPLHNGD
ncbi:MAG TPA: hypothetical protein VG206_01370 [Terriglobia bacterium]|nr:hypothetical protein [Terriglobia bacterium]